MIDKELEKEFFDNLEENLNKADTIFRARERCKMKTCKVIVFTTAGQTITFEHIVEVKVSFFSDRTFLKLLADDDSLVLMSFEHISYVNQGPYYEGGKEEINA